MNGGAQFGSKDVLRSGSGQGELNADASNDRIASLNGAGTWRLSPSRFFAR
jgi:hypothetical protein